MRRTIVHKLAASLAVVLALALAGVDVRVARAEGDNQAATDASPSDDAKATDAASDAADAKERLEAELEATITGIDTGAGAELAARVEQFTARYQEARAEIDALQERIDENERRIAELEAALPEMKARAAAGMRTLYKFNQASNGLIEFLLSADSFNDFIATVRYLDSIREHNASTIERLIATQQELEDVRGELAEEKLESDKRLVEAERALAEAEAARERARQLAAEQAASEAAEIEAAIEASRAAAATAALASNTEATFLTNSGNEAAISVGGDPGQATITANEVEAWAGRIDAYLADSPLAGHGRTFAEAALASGVDPRWSPAISCIESSKGRYCFKPFNAWGWGSSVWPDWDTAIRAHVSGLAAGYGYSITIAAAKKYCPPHWAYWYSGVSAEMLTI